MAAARGHDRRDGGLDGGLAASVLREVGWIAAARRDDANGAEGAGSGLFPGIGPSEGPALSRIARSLRAEARPSGRSVAAAATTALILAFFATTILHDAAFRGSLPTPMRSGGAVIGPAADGSGPRGVDAMNRNQILAAVAGAGISAAGAMAQDAVQWRVEDGGNGHWYRRLGEIGDWPTARTRCEQLGGHLATLTTTAEWNWAVSATGMTEGFVGAYQDHAAKDYAEPNGGWRWVTGEPFAFNGSSMLPFDDCPGAAPASCTCGSGAQDILFIMGCCSHRMNDSQDGTPADCNMSGDLPYPDVDAMIEWSADCNGDGIVDYGQCRDGSLPDFNGNNIPDCCEQGTACVVSDYPIQWRAQEGGNGHWYQLRPKVGDWFACRAAAQALHGDLASPSIQAENSLVERIVPPKQFPIWNRVFLGGRQLPGSAPNEGWYWVDGSEWTYTDWYINQPDGGELFLVTMPEDNGCTWGDYPADSGDIYYFIVEWSADCNGDGVVDYGQILQGQLADADGNGVPDDCELPCLADIDGNGEVNGIDLAIILDKWGTDGGKDYPNADIDGDGTVAGPDLSQVLSGWGPCQ